MGDIGFGELVVILLIVLLVFGAKRVPDIGRSLGRAIHEFKKGMSGAEEPPAADATKHENSRAGQA